MTRRSYVAVAAATAASALVLSTALAAQSTPAPSTQPPAGQAAPAPQLGALAPANRAKPRPKPPFDVTGVWLHANSATSNFRFAPPPGFKLTPEAQVHYDAARNAQAGGGVYRDDIGQCWPAGVPLIMTRVWPIAMMQYPTAIYMVSEFMNSLRVIYLDGRPHTDPDVVVRTFNGESIGRWEGDTLVVDTRHFTDLDKHWVDQGIPASKDFRMIERYRLINSGNTLEGEWTLIDPQNWEGEWKGTRRWNRVTDHDIQEVTCLPDLNEHLQSTSSGVHIR
jgi:hypothetical protein